MKEIKAKVILYLEFMRISFMNIMAYRMRYVVGVFTYLVYVSVYWFLWEAAYTGRDSIAGMSLGQMTTYVAVAWIARTFYHSDVDWDIHGKVSSGNIALDLIRPIDFQLMHFFTCIGEAIFRLVLFALPAGIVICSIYPVNAAHSFNDLLFFVLATFLAFIINFEITFITGLLAFKTQSVLGIMRAKYVAQQVLTGLIVPISLFPELLRKIIYLTPFPYIANVPLDIYLGKMDFSHIQHALLVQIIWIIVLFVFGRWFCKSCFKKLIIQGG